MRVACKAVKYFDKELKKCIFFTVKLKKLWIASEMLYIFNLFNIVFNNCAYIFNFFHIVFNSVFNILFS